MGKRLEDLHLRPEPSAEDRTARYDAAVAQEAEEFLADIQTMLAGGEYDWAADTLEGIYTTVEATGSVTPGQRRAVQNIGDSRQPDRHRHRYRGRRS